MQRQALKNPADVVIDSCNDHGIWFDYRELRSIVGRPRHGRERPRRRRHSPFEAIEDLLDFLEDLFD